MEKVFVVVRNGHVEIRDERGNSHGRHLAGNWESAYVNGDRIVATSADGRVEIYDKNGNYINHM